MTADRYVCMSCDRSHHEPGFCPHCSRDDLLDTHRESERELLMERRAARSRGRRFLLVAPLWLGGYFALSIAGGHLLQQAGITEVLAFFFASIGTMVLFTLVALGFSDGRKVPTEDTPFSEIDPVQWENMVAEPLTQEEASQEAPARRVRPTQRTGR